MESRHKRVCDVQFSSHKLENRQIVINGTKMTAIFGGWYWVGGNPRGPLMYHESTLNQGGGNGSI